MCCFNLRHGWAMYETRRSPATKRPERVESRSDDDADEQGAEGFRARVAR